MQIVGVGQINFWSGGSLWIGQSTGAVPPHAHHALQVSIGLRGTVRFRSAKAPGWTVHAAAFVPSHVPHAFDGTGSTTATIFCEPESEIGRRLTARFGTEAIAAIPETEAAQLASELGAVYTSGVDDDDLNQAAKAVLARLASSSPAGVPAPDPRILRALDEIGRRLDQPITLEDVAGTINLSPSRFRHLFVQETGVPFRAYILWSRLQHALQTALAGQSWTDAAYAANFADSAHLTRTFRRMFGVAPTALGREALPEAGRAAMRDG